MKESRKYSYLNPEDVYGDNTEKYLAQTGAVDCEIPGIRRVELWGTKPAYNYSTKVEVAEGDPRVTPTLEGLNLMGKVHKSRLGAGEIVIIVANSKSAIEAEPEDPVVKSTQQDESLDNIVSRVDRLGSLRYRLAQAVSMTAASLRSIKS